VFDAVAIAGEIEDFALENQSVKDRSGDDRSPRKPAQSSNPLFEVSTRDLFS